MKKKQGTKKEVLQQPDQENTGSFLEVLSMGQSST